MASVAPEIRLPRISYRLLDKESILNIFISRQAFACHVRQIVVVGFLLLLLPIAGCTWFLPPPFIITGASESLFDLKPVVRQPVLTIPLSGPLALPQAELSGLAWYGDTLILLPQFPEIYGSQLYGLPKSAIVAYLTGQTTAPLEPQPIPFDDQAVRDQLIGSEGYEALAFAGNRAYLTIETRRLGGMLGYVVAGEMAPDLSLLRLDPAHLTPIEPQANLSNMTDEALFLVGNQVATIYEANGLAVNPDPVVHLFDAATLTPMGVVPFPQIEYRITDATALDENGRFWAMNYFFPGDLSLRPFLRARGALEQFNDQAQPVERLLEFQMTPQGIVRTQVPPIALELSANPFSGAWIARNWEGVVRLETPDLRGFLIVTDRFPETMLAYVALP